MEQQVLHNILTVTTLSGLVFLVLGLIEPGLFSTTRLRVLAIGILVVAGGFAGFIATLSEAGQQPRPGGRTLHTRQDAEDATRQVWAGVEARTRALEAGRPAPEGAGR